MSILSAIKKIKLDTLSEKKTVDKFEKEKQRWKKKELNDFFEKFYNKIVELNNKRVNKHKIKIVKKTKDGEQFAMMYVDGDPHVKFGAYREGYKTCDCDYWCNHDYGHSLLIYINQEEIEGFDYEEEDVERVVRDTYFSECELNDDNQMASKFLRIIEDFDKRNK
jgi:hypothetical protein